MANSPVILDKLCSVFSLTYLVLIFCFLITTGSINGANGTRIVLQLVHRDSILRASPNVTISDNITESDDIRGPLFPDESRFVFLVNVSIGEPPLPQLLAMDTGSPLTWVRPLRRHLSYYPTRSFTHNAVTCESPYQCHNYYDGSDCENNFHCTFHITYLDNSWCYGILVKDTFTFATSTGGKSEVPDFLFGFANFTHGRFYEWDGIFGLSDGNQHSIVSRVGRKFSYCIGNINDPHYPYNQLVLGEGAIIEGDTTPMLIKKGGYYAVSLEGISVGETQLEINQRGFKFNVEIDTGSTLTFLQRSAYEPLKKEVMKLLDGLLEPVEGSNNNESLCYRGDLVRDLRGFPTVTFHFAQGADLSLGVEGMFNKETKDTFCMAVRVSTHEINIIGILAQQYYNVGFDLNAMQVSFQSIECELLED